MSDDDGYILAEVWSAKPSWLALLAGERVEFFETKIGPLLGSLVGEEHDLVGAKLGRRNVRVLQP